MNWWIKVFSFLELKVFLELMSGDKNYFKKICEKIISHFYKIQNRNLKNENIITNFLNLYPRISCFIIDDIDSRNEIYCIKDGKSYEKYLLLGDPQDSFIFSDYVLPNFSNSNIPFTYSFTNYENEIEFVSSNIYYFEFTIDKMRFRECFLNEKLIVGFVSALFNSSEFSFGDHFSFGVDCLNGIFKYDDQLFELSRPIIPGDTFGLGLEYLSKYSYRIILTLNGSRIHFENNRDLIVNNHILKIGVKLNLSYGISFNFGERIFMYNIRKLINSPKVINLCNSSFLHLCYNDEFINTNKISNANHFWKKKVLKQKKISESIYNLKSKYISMI